MSKFLKFKDNSPKPKRPSINKENKLDLVIYLDYLGYIDVESKYLQAATIRFFTCIQETSPTGEMINRDPNASILIVTDKTLLYLRIEREGLQKGKPTLLFKTRLSNLRLCDLHQTGNMKFGILYIMEIATSKGKAYQFQSSDLEKFDKLFSLLSV